MVYDITKFSCVVAGERSKLTNGVTLRDPFFEPRELFLEFIGWKAPMEGFVALITEPSLAAIAVMAIAFDMGAFT